MGNVQLDQTVIDNTAAAIESLVAQVNNFLAHPAVAQLPPAVTDALTQAVSDAGTAQNALQSAAAAAAPATTPAAPADTPPATS